MENTEHPLGQFIRQLMIERQISNNALAQAVGLSEGSIRNVLKYGSDPKTPAPSPAVLRALAEFFEIKVTWLYQLMGYLKPEDLEHDLDVMAEFMGRRIASLPLTQQKLLMDMVFTMEKSAGIYTSEGELLDQLYQGRELRQRNLNWLEEVDRRIGKIFKIATPDLYQTGIARRMSRLLDRPVTEKEIQVIAEHPGCRMTMNVLLPRKDMPTGLEKLYYLTHYVEEREISPDQKRAIIDTWEYLTELAMTTSKE